MVGKADRIATVLRAPALTQPPVLAGAYAATVRASVAVITVLNTEIASPQEQVEAHLAGTRMLKSTVPSPGPEELRRDLPDHPCLGQEESRAGPLRPQATDSVMRCTSRRSAP